MYTLHFFTEHGFVFDDVKFISQFCQQNYTRCILYSCICIFSNDFAGLSPYRIFFVNLLAYILCWPAHLFSISFKIFALCFLGYCYHCCWFDVSEYVREESSDDGDKIWFVEGLEQVLSISGCLNKAIFVNLALFFHHLLINLCILCYIYRLYTYEGK